MITLQQLEYFRALAATNHLTRTAEKLFISQTTLSNSIISLEKQLGTNLFDRVGRNMQLNETGQNYLEYVSQALDALENGRSYIEDRREQVSRKVSIAAVNSTVWSNLIHGFQKQYRNYSVQQLHSAPDQLRSLLLDMKVDYVIAGTDDLSLSGLEHQVFCHAQLYLCVPKEHPLADHDYVTLQDVQDENFIDLPQSLPFRRYADKLFKKAGIQRNVVLECDYMMSAQLIEAGFGVCLTTQIVRDFKLPSNNVYIPLAPDIPCRPLAIIWNPKRYLGKAAHDFSKYVMSAYHTP